MSYVFADKRLFPVYLLGYVDPTDHYAYSGIMAESGELRKYESFDELVKQVEQRREALGSKKIENLELKIQHYLYLVGEAHKSQFIQVSDIPRTEHDDIITGARLALEFSRQALNGITTAGAGGWVTSDVAEDRAQACINCVKNVELKKSKLQRFNDKISMVFTPGRKTSVDDKLLDCEVCGCALEGKVHFAAEAIKAATNPKIKAEAFPENFVGKLDKERHACWMRKILEKVE